MCDLCDAMRVLYDTRRLIAYPVNVSHHTALHRSFSCSCSCAPFFSASGVLCFGPSSLASIALILSIFANARCNLVKPKILGLFNLFPNAPDTFGLWCYEANNGVLYDARSTGGDSTYEAARALGTATLCLGFAIVIMNIVAGCQRCSRTVYQGIGALALCTSLCQGLVFLVYKSTLCDYGCDLDTGGKCGIAAVVLWFLSGVTSFAAGKKANA